LSLILEVLYNGSIVIILIILFLTIWLGALALGRMHDHHCVTCADITRAQSRSRRKE